MALAAAIASANGDPSYLAEAEELLARGGFSPVSQAPWEGVSSPDQAWSDDEFAGPGVHDAEGSPSGSPSVVVGGKRLSYAEAMRLHGPSPLDLDMGVVGGGLDDLRDGDGLEMMGGLAGDGQFITQQDFEARFPEAGAVALGVGSVCAEPDALAELSMGQLEVLRDVLHRQMVRVEAALLERARRQERWIAEEQLRQEIDVGGPQGAPLLALAPRAVSPPTAAVGAPFGASSTWSFR
jgi:hypothetical protein